MNQATGGNGGNGGNNGVNGSSGTGSNGGAGGAGAGGAVANAGSAAITNATIATNSVSGGTGGNGGAGGTGNSPGANGMNGFPGGGGLANTGSQLRVTNTILSANTGGTTTSNCSGTITDGGYNLEFNPAATCAFTIAVQQGNPNLDTLKDNGGPTQTIALLPDSAAIDTADPTACAAPLVSGKDQRGLARRSDRCSIGAFEADIAIPNPVPLPPRPGPAPVGVPNPVPATSRSIPSSGGSAPNPIPVPRR